ncbi:MAG: Kazal-type serine protease inhibitor domain-containing protein [Minicystis sp.]
MLKRAHWFGVVGLLAMPVFAALTWTGCQGTCASSDECASGEFCSMASGVCVSPRALGFCKPIPDDCPGIAQTVCGCDGKTYANACLASVARQSVASTGTCSVACGGPAGTKCPSGTYCHYSDGVCGAGSASGTCEAVPDSCVNATPSAVCGCDGKTYSSACAAQAAGVSLNSTGACPCGGIDKAGCAEDKFCNYDPGTCAQPNATGACIAKPTDCAPFSDPVCGCDNKTYENSCLASKAGISVYVTGRCPCGGPTQIDCPDGQYCEFPSGTCLNPNPVGTCAPVPDSCNDVQGYVCGCNGKTYLNACYAAQDGASVASLGDCKPGADAGAGGG